MCLSSGVILILVVVIVVVVGWHPGRRNWGHVGGQRSLEHRFKAIDRDIIFAAVVVNLEKLFMTLEYPKGTVVRTLERALHSIISQPHV
jgi:hypothetical protein